MKKIGILGGISSASTIDYYSEILNLYYNIKQDYYYPEITIESLDFQYFTDLEDQNQMEEYVGYIINGIKNLEKTGCDIIIMAANSPHSVLSSVRKEISTPIVSIVESVRDFALRKHMKKLLLTGIKYTMEHSFYQTEFQKYGIELIVPNKIEREKINAIIFDELSRGIITTISQNEFQRIIKKYLEGSKIDGVILGCTELPALVGNLIQPVPFINSLELHCEDTLRLSMDG